MLVFTQLGERSLIGADNRRPKWHPWAMTPAAYLTIRIDHERHGDWEVELPDEATPVRCRTLQEARRLAYRRAAQGPPCELVICDAYHRVAHRELVNAG
jgi:hypothetical protein